MKKHFSFSLFMIIVFVFAFAVMGVALSLLFPVKYKQEISLHAATYNLDPAFVASVINAESGYNTHAVSPAGARGLMQIMPSTAIEIAEKLGVKDFKISNLFDANTNILFGCYYLSYLHYKFNGEVSNILAAYNAGFNNVEVWLLSADYSEDGQKINKTPFKETNNYINRVKHNKKIYQKIYS